FSTVGKPRGRGKIQRFFASLSQVVLSRLKGSGRPGKQRPALLALADLSRELESYLVDEYLVSPRLARLRRRAGKRAGFFPKCRNRWRSLICYCSRCPKRRRVRSDGIHFLGMRYIDPMLAAYVGEEVLLRYDPRDMAEIRIFHEDRFLYHAICQ